jgi:hypothetical protein
MKKIVYLVILVGALALSGCATGPKFTDIKATLPPVAAGKGRIFLYRPSTMGAAVQPNVKLNGEVVGTAKPKGAFYVDREPGNYKIETSTEVTRELSLTLESGQTRYVKLNLSMGFVVGHVYPQLVDPAVGEGELAGCKFIGGK